MVTAHGAAAGLPLACCSPQPGPVPRLLLASEAALRLSSEPYEFTGFVAMDVTKSCDFIGFGAMDVTKPCEFIGFGAIHRVV